MAVGIEGSVIMYGVVLTLLITYFLYSYQPSKQFISRHGHAVDLFIIAFSIVVVILFYYLPYLLPSF